MPTLSAMVRPGRRVTVTALLGLATILSSACTVRTTVARPATAAAATATGATQQRSAAGAVNDTLVPHIRWMRTSAEQQAIFVQTYRLAAQELERLSAGRLPGSWAVILDADETILDNSEYQVAREGRGLTYTPDSWTQWVFREAAPPLPGSVAFTERVRQLGGRVAIVTNRSEVECDPTRRNLRAVGVMADVVLCKTTTSDKNARFEAVAGGTAAPGLPPVEVLMWIGDNIQDFPRVTQATMRQGDASRHTEFGRRYFVLPNPMYGSWDRNPLVLPPQ
jgi:5'-nucleotidase (lipoprotein e(P4) family)